MTGRRTILACVAAAGMVLVGVRGCHPAGQPQPAATARTQAGQQVPPPGAGVGVSEGPVMDSDRGPAPAAPSTRPTAWASVPTTPAAGPSLSPVSTTGNPRGLHPAQPVDTRNVDKVAEAFLTTAFTLDARVDTSPQAGFARAARWATSGYRPYLVTAPAKGGGGTWQHLVSIKGWTQVEPTPVTIGDKPADTPTATIRAFRLLTTTHGDDNSATQQTSYAYLTLARNPGGDWQVTAYTALD